MPLGGTKQKWLLMCLLGTIILSSFFVLMKPVMALEDTPEAPAAGETSSEKDPAKDDATEPDKKSSTTSATIAMTVLGPIATLLSFIVNFLLHLITIFAHLLIYIAGYNNFVKETAVTTGWGIVRDIANMFFVVVFLVIAIGTIMGVKQYHYKQTLPKLLLMAVLINFSLTICGVIIDFAQVIMLTFVHAFEQTAGGNFINGLGLREVSLINSDNPEVEFFKLIFSQFLAILVTLTAFVVMVIMTIVLLFRIVMLWLLLVISPLAFFVYAVPSKTFSGYFEGQWWKPFINNVISGPILAFFLWLALTVMAAQEPLTSTVAQEVAEGGEGIKELSLGASEMGKESNLLKYLISLGMLIGGLMMTKQLGVMGSDMAGKAPAWMQAKATGAAKWVGGRGWQGVDERLKLRERGYGALSRVPGFKSFGVAGASKARTERAARMGGLEPTINAATPQELDRLLKMEAFTIKNKDMQALAQKRALHDWKYQSAKQDEFKKKYEKQGLSSKDAEQRAKSDVKRHLSSILKDYEALGKSRGDRKMQDDAYSIKQSRPDIVSLDKSHDGRVKEIKNLTKLMTPLDARNKISAAALEDRAVYDSLSEEQKEFIEERGNTAQKSAIQKMRQGEASYQEKHPEVIDDLAKRTAFIQGLGNKVADIDPESLKKKEVVGAMADDQIGGLAKVGKLHIDSIDVSRLTANNGALAGKIAKEGNPALISEMAKKMGPDFANGIDLYRKNTPGLSADEDRQLRVTQLVASADITKSFDYNKAVRTFDTAGGADAFYDALQDRNQNVNVVAKLDVRDVSSNNYDNTIAQNLAMNLDKHSLGRMVRSKEIEPEMIEAIVNSIKGTIKNLPSQAPQLQEKLKYCAKTPGLREFV